MFKAYNCRLAYHKSHLLCLSGHFNYDFACCSCVVFLVFVDSSELKMKAEEMPAAVGRLKAMVARVKRAEGDGCGYMVLCGKYAARSTL